MRLKDVCSVFTDGDWIESKDQSHCGIRLIQTGNIGEGVYLEKGSKAKYISEMTFLRLKCTEIFSGDILVSRLPEPIGRACIIPQKEERMITAVDCTICRIDEKLINKEYLCYFMCSTNYYNQLLGNVTGTTRKRISRKNLGNVELRIPSLCKQIAVVGKLKIITKIIQQRKQELQLIESLIKARFVEMFGNPLDKSKANSIFTDCVVFNPKKSELDNLDIDVSFVPMECVGVDGSFTIKETGKASDYYKGYTYFKDGDVLLAKITPCFENGKVAIAEGCMNGIGFGTTEFHVSRPKEGVSTSYWIKYMLKNDLVHNLATINMTGSAGQKRIQTPFFEKLKVYLPPIEQQNQFAEFVKQVDKSKVVA